MSCNRGCHRHRPSLLRPHPRHRQHLRRLRIVAVDPGSKRVGLALSDPTETIAQPLTTIAAEPLETLAGRLAEVARSNEAARIVVGLPLRMDGSHGPEAAAARRLASQIEHESG